MNALSLWDSFGPLQGEAVASATVLVFALTYVGMALGRMPGLRVDRSGIAMTLLLMGGLMILSARFGAAGLYEAAANWIAHQAGRPLRLLGLTILISGVSLCPADQ
jgi:Na+/H+ antiporter NhaD/arsenite permease-like protein